MNRTIEAGSVPPSSRDMALEQLEPALWLWRGRSIIQECELRHLAKGLQSSTAELMTRLEVNIAHLKQIEQPCGHDELIAEIEETVSQIGREIMAISPLPALKPASS